MSVQEDCAVDGARVNRYRAAMNVNFISIRENRVSNSYVSIAAVIALGVSASAFATAAPTPAPRAAAPAAQSVPTRAMLLKNMDANFKLIDANGDGVLSQSELAAAEAKTQQQRLGAIRTRVDAEFTKLDTNKDGSLSKAEFMAAAPTSAGAAPNGSNILAQLDKNKDGKLSADEYRAPVLSRFDRMDTNHDGILSATERQAARATTTPRKK
jgi:hypothetical protein